MELSNLPLADHFIADIFRLLKFLPEYIIIAKPSLFCKFLEILLNQLLVLNIYFFLKCA